MIFTDLLLFYLLIFSHLYLIMVDLELFPVTPGAPLMGYQSRGVQNAFIYIYSKVINPLTGMFLESGIKAENLEEHGKNVRASAQTVTRAQDRIPGAVKQKCYSLRHCATSAVYVFVIFI